MTENLTFSSITSHELRHNLTSNRAPHMINPERSTDFLCIIQRRGGIAVRDDEDVFRWEDFQCRGQGGADQVGGFVAGDEEGGFVGGGGAVDEGDGFVGEGRVGLEEDEEGAECVAKEGCE